MFESCLFCVLSTPNYTCHISGCWEWWCSLEILITMEHHQLVASCNVFNMLKMWPEYRQNSKATVHVLRKFCQQGYWKLYHEENPFKLNQKNSSMFIYSKTCSDNILKEIILTISSVIVLALCNKKRNENKTMERFLPSKCIDPTSYNNRCLIFWVTHGSDGSKSRCTPRSLFLILFQKYFIRDVEYVSTIIHTSITWW